MLNVTLAAKEHCNKLRSHERHIDVPRLTYTHRPPLRPSALQQKHFPLPH